MANVSTPAFHLYNKSTCQTGLMSNTFPLLYYQSAVTTTVRKVFFLWENIRAYLFAGRMMKERTGFKSTCKDLRMQRQSWRSNLGLVALAFENTDEDSGSRRRRRRPISINNYELPVLEREVKMPVIFQQQIPVKTCFKSTR